MGRGAAEGLLDELDVFSRTGFASFDDDYELREARHRGRVVVRSVQEEMSLEQLLTLLADREQVALIDEQKRLEEIGEALAVYLCSNWYVDEPTLHSFFRAAADRAHAIVPDSPYLIEQFGFDLHLRESARTRTALCGHYVGVSTGKTLLPRGSLQKAMAQIPSNACQECWANVQQRAVDDPVRVAAEEPELYPVASDAIEREFRRKMGEALAGRFRSGGFADESALLAEAKEIIRPTAKEALTEVLTSLFEPLSDRRIWQQLTGSGRSYSSYSLKQLYKECDSWFRARRKTLPSFPRGERLRALCTLVAEGCLSKPSHAAEGPDPLHFHLFARAAAESCPELIHYLFSVQEQLGRRDYNRRGGLNREMQHMRELLALEYPQLLIDER